MEQNGWTIEELTKRVADTLAVAGVDVPNGRVTAVPDRRVIRWYATIGLLDRPLRSGGRQVRYGERHLLQLVAVKRRQALGRSLTEIQAELAGATNSTLRRVAGLPDALPDGAQAADIAAAAEEPPRPRFWAEPPPPPARAPGPAPEPVPPVPSVPAAVYPVPLHPDATLVLPAPPTPDDLAAVRAAARPLLDLLAARGLLTRPTTEELP